MSLIVACHARPLKICSALVLPNRRQCQRCFFSTASVSEVFARQSLDGVFSGAIIRCLGYMAFKKIMLFPRQLSKNAASKWAR